MQVQGSNLNQFPNSILTGIQIPTSHSSLTSLPSPCHQPYRAQTTHTSSHFSMLLCVRLVTLLAFTSGSKFIHLSKPSSTTFLNTKRIDHLAPGVFCLYFCHSTSTVKFVLQYVISISTLGLTTLGRAKNYILFIFLVPSMDQGTQVCDQQALLVLYQFTRKVFCVVIMTLFPLFKYPTLQSQQTT